MEPVGKTVDPIRGRSGRIEARTGLRMMPTFPRSPLSFRTAGFPQYGWKAGVSDETFPARPSALACSRAALADERFVYALRAPRRHSGNPALCRAVNSIVYCHGGWVILRPRGPRSGSGYSVPNRHHLLGPIRPTRRHIALSPHGGLYAMPSLCGSAEATREWFRAFAAHSFLTCRPL